MTAVIKPGTGRQQTCWEAPGVQWAEQVEEAVFVRGWGSNVLPVDVELVMTVITRLTGNR